MTISLKIAFRHGKEAFEAGESPDSSPYFSGSDDNNAWHKGYNEAKTTNAKLHAELYGADSNCSGRVVAQWGGGVKCNKCGAWFCY